jgi:hypothetical protein
MIIGCWKSHANWNWHLFIYEAWLAQKIQQLETPLSVWPSAIWGWQINLTKQHVNYTLHLTILQVLVPHTYDHLSLTCHNPLG